MLTDSHPLTRSMRGNAPRHVLEAVLTALAGGRISEAVEPFNDTFAFSDRALGLEFVDKGRLAEFFSKSRELFPDNVLEVICIHECGDEVIAEWHITGAETVHYGGPLRLLLPISVRGVSIVRIDNGKITRWSDVYDHVASRRNALAVYFTEPYEL
jgi:hypothetical protein